jgi:hypothetical protein
MHWQQPAAPVSRPGPGPVTAFVQPLGIGLLLALAFVLIYLTPCTSRSPETAASARQANWRYLGRVVSALPG